MGTRTGNPQWADGASGGTLITGARLNAIESAIDASVPTAMMGLSSTATWRLAQGQANGTVAYATGTLYLAPLPILRPCHVDGLAALCTTSGGASSFASIGLYADSGFAPAARVAQVTGADISTTGMKGGTFTAVLLAAGLYWAGLLVTAGTGQAFEKIAQVSGGSDADQQFPWLVMPSGTGATPSAGPGNDGSVATQSGLGALPNPFAGSLASDSNSPKIPPAVWLRMAT